VILFFYPRGCPRGGRRLLVLRPCRAHRMRRSTRRGSSYRNRPMRATQQPRFSSSTPFPRRPTEAHCIDAPTFEPDEKNHRRQRAHWSRRDVGKREISSFLSASGAAARTPRRPAASGVSAHRNPHERRAMAVPLAPAQRPSVDWPNERNQIGFATYSWRSLPVGWADGTLVLRTRPTQLVRTAAEEGLPLEQIAEIEEATRHPVRHRNDRSDRAHQGRPAVRLRGCLVDDAARRASSPEKETFALKKLGDELKIPETGARTRRRPLAQEVAFFCRTADRPDRYDLPRIRRSSARGSPSRKRSAAGQTS